MKRYITEEKYYSVRYFCFAVLVVGNATPKVGSSTDALKESYSGCRVRELQEHLFKLRIMQLLTMIVVDISQPYKIIARMQRNSAIRSGTADTGRETVTAAIISTIVDTNHLCDFQ